MTTLPSRIIALLAASVLIAPATCAASEMFSTFGPPPGYDAGVYMPVNFYTQPEIIGTQLAFAFTVPGPVDWHFDAVDIAASWDGTKENARFTLHGDDAGVPADPPLAVLGDNPAALAHAPAISVLTLGAGTSLTLVHGARYWLSIAPASLDASVPANDFVMLWLNPDRLVLQTSRNWFGAGPWEPWYAPAFDWTAPAFRILATPVPVPSSLALLGSVCTACAIVRRRGRG